MTPATGTGYFELDGERFVPRPTARSPWSAEMLHGRLLGGLAAAAVERNHGTTELLPARLTVDLFRSPPMEPVEVATELVRDGRRIRVVDAVLRCGEMVVARAAVVLLRRGGQPEGALWSPPAWDMPPPDELPAPEAGPMRMTELRSPEGRGMRSPGRKRVWLRDHGTLVDGEGLSPFVRTAMAADFASPLANSGAGGLGFINADITLYLSREPAGEWIGLEVADHLSHDGVAAGRCRLYDTAGAVGSADVCAVANAPMRRG